MLPYVAFAHIVCLCIVKWVIAITRKQFEFEINIAIDQTGYWLESDHAYLYVWQDKTVNISRTQAGLRDLYARINISKCTSTDFQNSSNNLPCVKLWISSWKRMYYNFILLSWVELSCFDFAVKKSNMKPNRLHHLCFASWYTAPKTPNGIVRYDCIRIVVCRLKMSSVSR